MLSFLFVILNAINVISVNFFIEEHSSFNQSRSIYLMMIASLLEILLTIEYNFFLCISFLILNVAISLSIDIVRNDENLFFLEFIIDFVMLLIGILFKKDISTLLRENFNKNYKLIRYFSYCRDLIDNMNCYVFTMKNKKNFVYNENFKKHLMFIQKK